MHIQSVLTAVVALSAASDAAILQPRKSPFSRALKKRQFGFGGGFNNGGFGGNNGGFGGNNGGFGGNNGGFDGNNGDAGQNNGDDGQNNGDDGQNNDNGQNNGGGGNGQLDPNVIQDASASDGNPDQASGQAASQTDDSNFINFCQGSTLTNGEQNEGGSCNGIPMGKIPALNRMVSAIFTEPKNGDTIAADTDFTISVQMLNFAPGTFTNPDNTYYAAPQDLDGNGNIIGHTHVTVQDLGGDLNPTNPLDPTQFAFFKGINDQGNGQGLLSADVEGGLPEGNYRLCSLVAAANHQPVIMPVAQRGAQDDCVRFTVSNNGGGGGNNGGNDQNQGDGGFDFGNGGDQNQGQDQDQDQNQDGGFDFGNGGDQNQDQNQGGDFDFGNGDNQNQDNQFGGDQNQGGGFDFGNGNDQNQDNQNGFGGGNFGGGNDFFNADIGKGESATATPAPTPGFRRF
ncbi:uncharacterized protein J7T54_001343 [Emericellopsis cladophorae]|uniref:Ribosomal protein s17 n=1 Tax=Emericellopsis cladophorae TaxID=2686198 RepID=A0A9P9Y2V0_9HYPO|nr:uncharacterized protein J7T54_001343 [Emericellopsis cladophorae]KAI6782486.1 hypothetical protein J7T54_001343 [Emericellopsis cladophorae]